MTMQVEVSVSLNLFILFNSEFYLSVCIFVFFHDRNALNCLVGLLFFFVNLVKLSLQYVFAYMQILIRRLGSYIQTSLLHDHMQKTMTGI